MASASSDRPRLALSVLESIQEGIVVVNELQNIVYTNVGAELLFARSRDEMRDRSIGILIPQRQRSRIAKQIRDFQDSGKSFQRLIGYPTISALQSTGDEFPAEINFAKCDHNGQPWIVAVIRDLSNHSQKDAIASLRKEYDAAESRAAILLDEIRRLRSHDADSDRRVTQLERRIADAIENRSEDGNDLQNWFAHLKLWQRIVAALVAAMLLIAQGAEVNHVLDEVIERIEQIEQTKTTD